MRPENFLNYAKVGKKESMARATAALVLASTFAMGHKDSNDNENQKAVPLEHVLIVDSEELIDSFNDHINLNPVVNTPKPPLQDVYSFPEVEAQTLELIRLAEVARLKAEEDAWIAEEERIAEEKRVEQQRQQAQASSNNSNNSGVQPPAGGTVWDTLAVCESSSNWAINTGNGYYGGLQMDMDFWSDYGGYEFAPRPDLASREQQIIVAERARDSGRGYGPWPTCSVKYGLR